MLGFGVPSGRPSGGGGEFVIGARGWESQLSSGSGSLYGNKVLRFGSNGPGGSDGGNSL